MTFVIYISSVKLDFMFSVFAILYCVLYVLQRLQLPYMHVTFGILLKGLDLITTCSIDGPFLFALLTETVISEMKVLCTRYTEIIFLYFIKQYFIKLVY